MKKTAVKIFTFIFYFIFNVFLGIASSVKYIFIGHSIIGKILIIGMYLGAITSAIYNPIVLKIMVGIAFLIDIWLAFGMLKCDTNDKSNEKENSSNESKYGSSEECKNPFFDGMTLSEAKKEYRKLMKKYHPDNMGGSLEMTQKITESYSNYCDMCSK